MKQPKKITINQRTSSITNAFYGSILPYHRLTKEQELQRLHVLGYEVENVNDATCIYCGEHANTWDHLYPLIVNQAPSGYFHEINNLVPSCNTCNSSKGNQHYENWLIGNSERVMIIRNVKGRDTDAIIDLISRTEEEKKPRNILDEIDLIRNQDDGLEFEKYRTEIFRLMEEARELSTRIRNAIEHSIQD